MTDLMSKHHLTHSQSRCGSLGLLLMLLLLRLGLSPSLMKNPFSVAVGLRGSIKDESTRGLKLERTIKVGRHRSVVGVACILRVDDARHLVQRLRDLIARHDRVL